MDIENLPTLNPRTFGDLVDDQSPILSLHWEAQGAHRAVAHTHPRAQIIYPLRGVYWADSPQGSWVVPMNQAVWIPSGVYHEVYTNNSVEALILFVDIAYTDRLLK